MESKELSAQELFEKAEELYKCSEAIYQFRSAFNRMKQAYEKQRQEIEKAIDDKIKFIQRCLRDKQLKVSKQAVLCGKGKLIALQELKQTISKGVVK